MRVNDENRAPGNPEVAKSEPAPLNDTQQIRKDVAYSPSSEAETAAKQDGVDPEDLDDGIDPDDVRAVPGTGGPDDTGDVDVDPDDLNLPSREPGSRGPN
ncbi:hypothetical protein ESP57_08555 [Agromyces fucosus]|uniref:Uncharacterized protein n=1 Tax=Agromyces fucosus TaxID=41985 RepID=A0A4V1QSN4_9MICO|nr:MULTISPECIES: hypothetical protein [Agromyces]KQZ11070.1 hypothetical protein ASD23_02865 [Agromyces sp. Root1464]RXZ49003.1 hypothetical protein ESP57_08555 [Agromyces fucosus]